MHIPTEILTSAGGDMLFHEGKALVEKFFASDAGKKVAEALGKKFEKPFTDKERAQIINLVFGSALRKENPNAPVNIERHLKYAAENDWTGDNTLVKCLLLAGESERAKDKDENYIYPNPEDDQRLITIFAEIGDIDDFEKFRQRLERYDHDPHEQIIRKAVREAKKGVDTVGNWIWGFVAYVLAWPLIQMAFGATGSRWLTWGITLVPAIALLFIAKANMNLVYVILGNWADKKFGINVLSTAWSVFGLHFLFGIYLGFYPIKSFDLVFLLYIASIALFFLGMGKGLLVGLGKLVCYGLVIFAFYANHAGITSADTSQVEAAADTTIAIIKKATGFGPGSSQDNPIPLGTNPNASPIQLGIGSVAWFRIEPMGGWSQSIVRPDNSKFSVRHLSDKVLEQRYVAPKGQPGRWDTAFEDGPEERPVYPPNSTKMRFDVQKTIWAQIAVVSDN